LVPWRLATTGLGIETGFVFDEEQELVADHFCQAYILGVPKKKPEDSKKEFRVGDPVLVHLHTGKIVEATIKAVTPHSNKIRLQVDFGKDETALIYPWQILKDRE
jgi:hypothetical protein